MKREKHIVRSYDEELEDLQAQITQMCQDVIQQLDGAVHALVSRDAKLAGVVIENDKHINLQQQRIDQLIVSILAKRQPLASDLRAIVATQKITVDLERIADYAAVIAQHSQSLPVEIQDLPIQLVEKMVARAIQMLTEILQVYASYDETAVPRIWKADQEINGYYTELIETISRLLVSAAEDIQVYTALLFIGRSCERVGDHIKNVAEQIYYLITGESFCIK